MRILGIDPGLNITGYAIVEGENGTPRIIEAGVIRNDQNELMEYRLHEISRELTDIIRQFNPDALAIEELYSHYDHPKTAIIMGHARGVVILKATEARIPVFPYASTRIKKSLTGNGRASKRQVQMMIRSTFGLPGMPEPPDAADALAIALCHCRVVEREGVVA